MDLNICWGMGVGGGPGSNSANYIPTIYCIIHLDEFIIRFFKTLLLLARVNIWPEKVGSEYVYDAKSQSTEEIIQEIVPLFLRVICFFGLLYKSLWSEGFACLMRLHRL